MAYVAITIMKLSSLNVTNFRGLAHIEASFKQPVSVIVGPNAIGKTSVLEAIRLVKSVLAPRFANEPHVTLTDMGALSQDRIRFESLAGDTDKALDIQLRIEFDPSEIEALEAHLPSLALLHARNISGIAPTVPDVTIAQFFSSQQGKSLIQQAQKEIANRVQQLRAAAHSTLSLVMDPATHAPRGADIFSQEFITILDQALPSGSAYFTYFPADRAMPTGEINIQLGAGDVMQQLHSYMGQPGTKYNRLKNLIVTHSLLGADQHKLLEEDFRIIFDTLLVGKRLKSVRVSPHGLLSVLIEEIATGKVYDIDRMSSGEKGLILQFLTMRRHTAPYGVILIDEPELHLNPAVCKKLISFLVDHVITPTRAQAIVCTHSPEVLADAFEREDCALFHLRSPTDLSPVYKQDKEEIFEALKRLGASTSDVLFSKGTLFVEGPHDADVLELGFPDRVSGFKIRQLHGRNEVEKEIKTLQAAEVDNKLKDPQFFIFDRDRKPVSVPSTALVRVKQWDRYCLENFLLDSDAIYEVRNDIRAGNPPESRGSVKNQLKELAMKQLNGVVVREVYAGLEPDNPGLRPSEVDTAASFQEIAKTLYDRLSAMRDQLGAINESDWTGKFIEQCQAKVDQLRPSWEDNWATECDGKRVLRDMHKAVDAKVSSVEFKRRIVTAMSARQTENWRVVDSYLSELLPA